MANSAGAIRACVTRCPPPDIVDRRILEEGGDPPAKKKIIIVCVYVCGGLMVNVGMIVRASQLQSSDISSIRRGCGMGRGERGNRVSIGQSKTWGKPSLFANILSIYAT